jgi:hypothetical protein
MRLTVFGLAGVVFAGVAPASAGTMPTGGFDATALSHQAQAGDIQAQFQLGTLYYVGIGIVQDYRNAAVWLNKAAQAGDAEAQCELGFLYQTGSFGQGPPPPDLKQAASWYAKSAAQGDACGQFALAALYVSGKGVTQDAGKAASLSAEAATQGLTADPASFPLEQLQQRFYAAAYKISGQTEWVDTVSRAAGGGE